MKVLIKVPQTVSMIRPGRFQSMKACRFEYQAKQSKKDTLASEASSQPDHRTTTTHHDAAKGSGPAQRGRDDELRRGGSGKTLSDGEELRKCLLVQPVALIDQVIAQDGNVGLRPPERDQAQRPECRKDYGRR